MLCFSHTQKGKTTDPCTLLNLLYVAANSHIPAEAQTLTHWVFKEGERDKADCQLTVRPCSCVWSFWWIRVECILLTLEFDEVHMKASMTHCKGVSIVCIFVITAFIFWKKLIVTCYITKKSYGTESFQSRRLSQQQKTYRKSLPQSTKSYTLLL